MCRLWLLLSLVILLVPTDANVTSNNTFESVSSLRTFCLIIWALFSRNMPSYTLSFIRASLPRRQSGISRWPRHLGSQAYIRIPKHIQDRIPIRMDTDTGHPIGLTIHYIKEFFLDPEREFNKSQLKFRYIPFDSDPVTIRDNFDELQVPLNHVSREPSDNFYVSDDYVRGFAAQKANKHGPLIAGLDHDSYDKDLINRIDEHLGHSIHRVLPTHATSHLPGILRSGITRAIYSGKVFRRDAIDSKHYPVFHQLDGFMLFTRTELEAFRRHGSQGNAQTTDEELLVEHLKQTLEALVSHLLRRVTDVDRVITSVGSTVPTDKHDDERHTERDQKSKAQSDSTNHEKGQKIFRWDTDTSFPFTQPSMELYLKLDNDWIEILGSGKLKDIIISNNLKLEDSRTSNAKIVGGWAFGIGLERLVMALCRITDIRQFWETDDRFLRQYSQAYRTETLPVFRPYSRNPPVSRDISFYVDEPTTEKGEFQEPEFIEILEQLSRDYIEDVKLLSTYVHPKNGRRSLCYRVTYRAMGENLTNQFVNRLHQKVLDLMKERFNIELR